MFEFLHHLNAGHIVMIIAVIFVALFAWALCEAAAGEKKCRFCVYRDDVKKCIEIMNEGGC